MMRAGQSRTSGRRRTSSAAAQPDCAKAFQKIALDCAARVRAYHRGARAGDPEAVHQIRVALTQLRTAVRFFAAMTDDAGWRDLKRQIAWLNTWLGAARDSDVMVAYARRKRYRAWAQRGVGQALARRQVQDHRRLARYLDSRRFQALIEAMSGWIEHGPWLRRWERNGRRKSAMSLEAYSARELDRWRRQLVRKGRQLESLGGSRRHRLRIRAKRLRYMLELLTDTVPLRCRKQLGHVHLVARRLQRVLGDLRDLERFARLGGPAKVRSPADEPPDYRRRRKKLLRAAVEAHRSLEQAAG
jgi:CHAD domain-containing protein